MKTLKNNYLEKGTTQSKNLTIQFIFCKLVNCDKPKYAQKDRPEQSKFRHPLTQNVLMNLEHRTEL